MYHKIWYKIFYVNIMLWLHCLIRVGLHYLPTCMSMLDNLVPQILELNQPEEAVMSDFC